MADRPASSAFDLSEVLPYAVVRVAHVLEQAFAAAIAQEGLTPRHFGILAQFARTDTTTAAAIARALDVTPQSVGPQIDALCARGLITRSPGHGRGRPLDLSLTAEGKLVLRRALAVAESEQARLTAHMTERQQRTLMRQLTDMARRARAAPERHDGATRIA